MDMCKGVGRLLTTMRTLSIVMAMTIITMVMLLFRALKIMSETLFTRLIAALEDIYILPDTIKGFPHDRTPPYA